MINFTEKELLDVVKREEAWRKSAETKFKTQIWMGVGMVDGNLGLVIGAPQLSSEFRDEVQHHLAAYPVEIKSIGDEIRLY